MPGIVFQASSKATNAPDIEADIYDAKFTGVSTKFITGGQYGDGDRWEWEFALFDDDGEALYHEGDPITVTKLTSMSLNPAAKTRSQALRVLDALMSKGEMREFEAGELALDAGDFVGRPVQVEVFIKDSGWPGVGNVLPPRRAKRRAATIEDEE